MKTTTVNPKENVTSCTVNWYRLVLALIMFICLSYASFAAENEPSYADDPPVEFKSLSIQRTGNSLLLQWTVEKEQDVSHYIIEQSNNGKDFRVVAYVFPFEDQTVSNSYSIKAPGKLHPSGTYRIRSVTQAREEQISAPVKVAS